MKKANGEIIGVNEVSLLFLAAGVIPCSPQEAGGTGLLTAASATAPPACARVHRSSSGSR